MPKETGQHLIQKQGENKFDIQGDLIFSTVGAIYEKNNLLLTATGETIEINLAGVKRADSSGLALIIEWLRIAKQLHKPLHFTHVPKQILDLAKLSSLEDLFKKL